MSVIGNDQVVTYDDSNVFLARNGPINANTGDTDSSGLNAVDVVGSRVRSGNSGDGEGDGEDKDEDEESEALPKGPGSDVQHSPQPAPTGRGNGRDDDDDSDQHGLPVTLAQFPTEPRRPRGLDVIGPLIRLGNLAGALAGQEQVGEGEEDDKDEKEDGLDGADARRPGDTSATVTDEGASIASGSDSFVVGADGYDDVSIRSRGDRNIVTYDDSNLVIGGEGKVNAQIGDSDTGGAVVMGIVDSDVQAGCEGDLCYSDGPSPDRKRAGTEWPIPNAGRDHHSRTEWPLSNSSRDRRSRQVR